MAATDARPVPRKNAAFRFYFAVRKNDGTLITTWAGQDSEVSLDGASFSDCANEATEIGTTGCGYVDFTSSEMNADCVVYKLTVTNTDALPLVFTFFPEEVGDYRADVVQVGGDTQSATDLKDFADAGYDPSTNKVQGVVLVDTITTYTGNTPQTGDAFSRIGATGSGLTSLAPSATALSTVTWSGTLATNLGTTNTTVAANLNATITSRMATYTQPTGFLAATFPTTVASTTNITAAAGIQVQSIVANAITASAMAADAVAEIADGVWDEDATGHQTQGTFGQAIGDPVADTNTIFKATVTDATGATVGIDVAAVLDDTGTSGVAVAAGSKTGYTLTATTGLGNQTADITGTITTVTTATNVTTVNGLAAGVITAAAIATGAIDADSLATDAVNEIVDQVWDELLSGHAGAGSAGLALSTASSGGVDPSVLADAIWDEALSGHSTAGTAGKALSDVLVDTAEIGTAGAGLTVLATAANLAAVAGYLDTEIAAILADTNELQTDWANSGRLYLLLDDIPTNSEFALRTLLAAEYATAANLLITNDRVGFILAQEVGACADAGTAAETYQITINATTYTVDHTGLDATGNRGTATLTKS
jgi:hypothetical protein